MQFFVKIVNGWNLRTFSTKSAMSDVWKVFQSHATDYLGVIPEAYLEPSRTIWSNIYEELFCKNIWRLKSLTIFAEKLDRICLTGF